MRHELIERYIYAITRHLPQKIRTDVEKELESLISDMLDSRCGDITPTDKDVRVVLTELGTPQEMAVKYSGDEQKSLISGVYFITYKHVLRIVLPIVAAAVALGMIISVLSNPSENPVIFAFRLIGQTLGGTLGGVFQAFAIITFIFVVLERTKTDLSGDHLSYLPVVPKQIERIKPYEPIIGILWSVTFAVIFLGCPQIMGFWFEGAGWLPVFDVAVIRGFWLPIILLAVLGIAEESVKLLEGRHTKRTAIVTLTANMLTIVLSAVILLNNAILNPEFFQQAGDLLNIGREHIMNIASRANLIFFGIICFGSVADSAVVAVKYFKNIYSKTPK
jgi:hypothetical protein